MTLLSTLFPDMNVRPVNQAHYGGHRWNNLFGIELELENIEGPGNGSTLDGWQANDDASLRNGLEFISTPPMGGADLELAIARFYEYGMDYTNGPRTSTHIHVNMMDATVAELSSMTAIMYIIEEALYLCVEETRKWGGYSVPLSDMRPLRLRNILNPPDHRVFVTNVSAQRSSERYYGFNCNVGRHGTAEFRYFPGGPTKDELCEWVDLVALVKNVSKVVTIQYLSDRINNAYDLERFIREYFGYWADRLLAARSADTMIVSFDTVMAMATDPENFERSGGVIHVNDTLLRFMEMSIFQGNPEGFTYLTEGLPPNRLISEQDWHWRVMQARNYGNTYISPFLSRQNYAPPIYASDDEEDNEPPEEEEERDVEEEASLFSVTNDPVARFLAEDSASPLLRAPNDLMMRYLDARQRAGFVAQEQADVYEEQT